jgi:putative endonuclease
LSAPAPKLSTAAETGNYGERVAASYVRKHGYRVLTRNFQSDHGEIDLVCRLGELLIFVEVRTRAEDSRVRPIETIDERKREALRRTALRYLSLLERKEISYRFDAVEVILNRGKVPVCTLLSNIFA